MKTPPSYKHFFYVLHKLNIIHYETGRKAYVKIICHGLSPL